MSYITAKTQVIAVLGDPVAHASSPSLLNAVFEKLGMDYVFVGMRTEADDLATALQGIKAMHVRGFNVSSRPHRENILDLLDVVTPAARVVGSVNTVVNDDGVLTGYMTDGMGCTAALTDAGVPVAGSRVTVIGSGGAGTAIQVQLALSGARSITVFNQQDFGLERAQVTRERLAAQAPETTFEIADLADRNALRSSLEQSDLLIDATPVGMGDLRGQTNIPDLTMLRPDLAVFHTVYRPRITRLIQDARDIGAIGVSGFGMLVGQARVNFKLWTGQELGYDVVAGLLPEDD